MTVVTDIDLTSADVIANPYPHFAAARSRADVQWHEGMQMWLAFSHSAASAVLRARTLGRIWTPRWPDRPMPAFTLIHVHSLLEMEPPEHTRLRRLVASAFGRGHVERLRPRIAQMASSLADDLERAAVDGSPVDLISLYAEPLPVQVIAELLGVPRVDWALLRPWSNAIVKMYEYQVSEEQKLAAELASAEFVSYLRGMVADRRGGLTDDLVSSLITETDAEGGRLSEDELITTCTLLLNAGHEATVNVTGNAAVVLSRHSEQRAGLTEVASSSSTTSAAASVIATAVEELIRYDSPLQLFERTAITDTEIGGVTIAKGQKIAALLGSANRDPAVFDQPDRLDLTRSHNPHLGFGGGIHFCVGAPLARIELQTSLSTLTSRFPSLALAGEPPPPANFVIRGVPSLLVTLD